MQNWADVSVMNDPSAPTFDRMMARERVEARAVSAARVTRERREAEDAEASARRRALFEELLRVYLRLVGRLQVREYHQAIELAGGLLAGIERVDRSGWSEYLNPTWRAESHHACARAFMGRARSSPTHRAADLAAAEQAVLEAARLVPHESWPVTELGIVHICRDDYSRAAATLARAVGLDPADFWARLYLGLVRIEVGQIETGVRELVRVHS